MTSLQTHPPKPPNPMPTTVNNGFPSSKSETSGSLHEKPNPTDPTHLHLSQTQIRWDPERSRLDPSRFSQISTRYRDPTSSWQDSSRSGQISTRSRQDSTSFHHLCCSIDFYQNRSCPPKTNWTELWFLGDQTSYHLKWSSQFQVQ